MTKNRQQLTERETKMSSRKFKMEDSWGVGSVRHTSGTLVYDEPQNTLIDVPIGPSITRWDLSTGQRLLTFQAHRDVVTCMRMSHDRKFIATSCDSGEVKLWDAKWECLDTINAPMGCQYHLAWSRDSQRFLIIGNGPKSALVVYKLISSTNNRGSLETRLELDWQVMAADVSELPNERVQPTTPPVSDHSGARDYHYCDAFYMGELTAPGNALALLEREGKPTLIQLYSGRGELVKTLPVHSPKGTGPKSVYISEANNGCYAVGLSGGRVIIVTEDLNVSADFNVGFTARTCVWDGDCLVLPTDSGKLVWWSMKGAKVTELKFGSPDITVRIDWSVSGGNLIWVIGFSAIRLLSVKRDPNGVVTELSTCHMVKSHDISCCGAGFSPSGRVLGSGDLTGTLWVYGADNLKSTFQTFGSSVRCLAWKDDVSCLVGDLAGGLYECTVGGASKPLLSLEGSVITMKFNQNHNLLAVGTNRGMLLVYKSTPDGLVLLISVLAHAPKEGPQDKRFGQLTKQAEIWSLCWSPDEHMVATCSEDQSTNITSTSDWKCVKSLTGHSMAVTSVDWKAMGTTSLIATCSDDRTVRLSDGVSYQLIRVLDTKEIYGWHTLTYLSFQPAKDSNFLLCTTQNGHVVVWDAVSGEVVSRGKLHLGSIEGLDWSAQGRVMTVGADCVVNVFTVV